MIPKSFYIHTKFQVTRITSIKISYRSSTSEVFLQKADLKICKKLKGKQPCRSAISIKLLCNFIEITLRHRCSPVNLLHIFRTSFPKNTSRRLLLNILIIIWLFSLEKNIPPNHRDFGFTPKKRSLLIF